MDLQKGLRAADAAFEKFDVILSPAAPTTALPVGQALSDPLKMYLGDIYTVSVNLAGLPAVTMPCVRTIMSLSMIWKSVKISFGLA